MSDADVVVLGAGAAGLGAAMWCASLGLKTVALEARAQCGGQLARIVHPITNLPGFPTVSAAALRDTLHAQARDAGVVLRADTTGVLDAEALGVTLEGGERLTPRAVILATGVRRRALEVPGEKAFRERGVYDNVGLRAPQFAGLSVLVVGGGDDAFEHAVLLGAHAQRVMLAHRSDRFTARPAMQAKARALENVEVRAFTRVTAIEGDKTVRAARLDTPDGEAWLAVDAVFVCIGVAPQTGDWRVALTPGGYVRVDRLQRTSRAGVWAAGDVCSPEAPTLSTAFGQGAVAAKSIAAQRLGASAAVSRPAGASDRLRVRGISLPARIGVYAREKKRLQTLNFDVDFEVDAMSAAPGDLLRDTIDYASVVAMLEGLLGQRHYNLIETVAETVAAALLANFGSRRVRVRVTKPGVPQHQASASVEVVRERA